MTPEKEWRLLLRSHQPVSEKLEAFGFRQTEDGWYWACPIHAGDYEMQIVILANGRPDYTLIDQKTKEAYALVKVASAQGAYVEALRKECGDVLLTVIDRCYDRQPHRQPQTRRILKWIEETYAVKGEYLWNDHPDHVVFRHPENRRWFAMILSVSRQKLYSEQEGEVEILNLKLSPDRLQECLRHPGYAPGYHMNKKYWCTLLLDEPLSDEEIWQRIEESRAQTR